MLKSSYNKFQEYVFFFANFLILSDVNSFRNKYFIILGIYRKLRANSFASSSLDHSISSFSFSREIIVSFYYNVLVDVLVREEKQTKCGHGF